MRLFLRFLPDGVNASRFNYFCRPKHSGSVIRSIPDKNEAFFISSALAPIGGLRPKNDSAFTVAIVLEDAVDIGAALHAGMTGRAEIMP